MRRINYKKEPNGISGAKKIKYLKWKNALDRLNSRRDAQWTLRHSSRKCPNRDTQSKNLNDLWGSINEWGGTENIFEKVLAEIFADLKEELYIQDKRTQMEPKWENHKGSDKHVISKLLKNND